MYSLFSRENKQCNFPEKLKFLEYSFAKSWHFFNT